MGMSGNKRWQLSSAFIKLGLTCSATLAAKAPWLRSTSAMASHAPASPNNRWFSSLREARFRLAPQACDSLPHIWMIQINGAFQIEVVSQYSVGESCKLIHRSRVKCHINSCEQSSKQASGQGHNKNIGRYRI
jgi:hypothetical protein